VSKKVARKNETGKPLKAELASVSDRAMREACEAPTREAVALATCLHAIRIAAAMGNLDELERASQRWLSANWHDPFPRPKNLKDKSEAALALYQTMIGSFRFWTGQSLPDGKELADCVAYDVAFVLARGYRAVLGVVPDAETIAAAIQAETDEIALELADDGIPSPYCFAGDDAPRLCKEVLRRLGMPRQEVQDLVRAAELTTEADGGEPLGEARFPSLVKRRRIDW